MKFANTKTVLRLVLLFTLLHNLLLLVGCGAGGATLPSPAGGGSNGGSGGAAGVAGGVAGGGGNSSGSTAVLVNLGDFASLPDNIVSFELTIDAVSLRSANGDIALLGDPRRFEVSRLKAEPLVLANLPQGKYSGIVIDVSNPEISFIDSGGVLHENIAASLTSSSVTNPSEFGFGATPGSINLNLFLEASFGGDGGITVKPALNFSTGGQPTKDLVGRILGTDGDHVDLDVIGLLPMYDPSWFYGAGAFSFATDSSTDLQNFHSLSYLTTGRTAEVDAVLGTDGTFHATKVRLENDDASKVVTEGIVLHQASPQLKMMVREVHGPGDVTLPEVGKSLTVNANAVSEFRFDPDGIDLNNLDFTPTFDALTIVPGQNVRAAAASGSATVIAADQLKLVKQSVDGTPGAVTANSVSGQYSFPLNLSPDSAFAMLTGHTTVYVTLQPSTQKYLYFGAEDCVSCIVGAPVRVRGLLFSTGGQYRLVAEWLAVM